MQTAAIILFNNSGLETARRIKQVLGETVSYGLAERVEGADETFVSAGDTISRLYRAGHPVIGLCAAGILIRVLAPHLENKRGEPPVIAVSEDGRAIVPLLGGLTGANELAGRLAEALGGQAALTGSGARRFGIALEAPPEGYVLENPGDAKQITSDILGGEKVRLIGQAPWLEDSTLPFSDDGQIFIVVSHERRLGIARPGGEPVASTDGHVFTTTVIEPFPADGKKLIYRPKNVVAGITRPEFVSAKSLVEGLEKAGIARQSLAALAFPGRHPLPGNVKATARELGIPLRLVDTEADRPFMTTQDIVVASNAAFAEMPREGWAGCCSKNSYIFVYCEQPISLHNFGRSGGLLSVVGIGPGDGAAMTLAVRRALAEADDLVGYQTYLDLVPRQSQSQIRHASDNRVELARARQALDLAAEGRRVVLISSGDPGIFAMSAAVMEALDKTPDRWPNIDIKVLPGVSAMQTAAAKTGALLGHDFCAISLSDIRKPWAIIERRLRAALAADLVIALYNPASKNRSDAITRAHEIFLELRAPDTPVVIGRNLGRDGERLKIVRLADFNPQRVDMRTIILVGSSQSRTIIRPDGSRFAYTPRDYPAEETD